MHVHAAPSAVPGIQLIAKKCAAVRYQVEDLLASFPKADGGPAGDAVAEAAQPMQIDG